MPKMKTRSTTAKRFLITKSGKVKRAHQNRRHILTKMSTKRKRSLRKTGYLAPTQEANVKKQLPYA